MRRQPLRLLRCQRAPFGMSALGTEMVLGVWICIIYIYSTSIYIIIYVYIYTCIIWKICGTYMGKYMEHIWKIYGYDDDELVKGG